MLSDKSIDLYQAIQDANEERVFKHWHASSIAECPRAHYFKRSAVKPINIPTAAKIIRWDAGHALEDRIRPHAAKLYKNLKSNHRMTSKTLDLTGEYDNYSKEESTLVEVKSVHDYAFIDRDGETTLKEQVGTTTTSTGRERKIYEPKLTPYLHHQMQQECYKLLIEGAKEGEVKKIDYIYLSMSGRVVTYSTEPSEEISQAVIKRLQLLSEAWDKQEPPECICRPSHRLWGPVMQWCDYAEKDADGNLISCCNLDLLTKEAK